MGKIELPSRFPRIRCGAWTASAAALGVLTALFFFFRYSANDQPAQSLSFEDATNSRFRAEAKPVVQVPTMISMAIPPTDGGYAVWGATGRDDKGGVWFATSGFNVKQMTARLYQYNPAKNTIELRGDTVSQLRAAGFDDPNLRQAKIHSKILQAGDGCLYFTSMDEPSEGTEKAPRWGGHLWRLRPTDLRWEHLLATDHGLIALAGGGDDVFALGFPDHALYCYHIPSMTSKRTIVGSVEGHISRNLLADANGHVYAPRLKFVASAHAMHTLVEFDKNLNEISEHELPHYQNGAAGDCHGITAYTFLRDGSIAFTTHPGRLFRLFPKKGGASRLEDVGWFHPKGKAYAPSLFTTSGNGWLYGLARREWDGGVDFEWVCYDLETSWSIALPLNLPKVEGGYPDECLLYGCHTIDDLGAYYICGAYRTAEGRRPVVLRTCLAPFLPSIEVRGAKLISSILNHPERGPIRVACVGDSITEGREAGRGKSYPDQLARLLGENCVVRSFGVRGATVMKGGDSPYRDQKAFHDALRFDADLVIILLGTNDIWPQNWQRKATFANDYAGLIDEFAKSPAKPRVFCCLPPPMFGKRGEGINELAFQEELPGIRRVAEGKGASVVDVRTPLCDRPECFPDGVHPNAAGATALATIIRDQLGL